MYGKKSGILSEMKLYFGELGRFYHSGMLCAYEFDVDYGLLVNYKMVSEKIFIDRKKEIWLW